MNSTTNPNELIKMQDLEEKTALHIATFNKNSKKMIKILINSLPLDHLYEFVNFKDRYNNTALELGFCNESVIRLLVKAGAHLGHIGDLSYKLSDNINYAIIKIYNAI